MNKLLWEYVKSYDTCARSKILRHRPFGLLQPLPIPNRPWGSIAMDFIIDLPSVRTKNSILVVVDRLTKMAHFTPVHLSRGGKLKIIECQLQEARIGDARTWMQTEDLCRTQFPRGVHVVGRSCLELTKLSLLSWLTWNNTTHASTGINPFFANYSFHPRFSLEIPGDFVNPSAGKKATRLG